MRRVLPRLALAALALLALSCASSKQLARESQSLLQSGHNEEAFEKARRALDKDPSNQAARASMRGAAIRLAAARQQRILNLADVDSLAAARQILDLATFRHALADYRVELPLDTAFASAERAIRTTVARDFYDLGLESMREHLPKRAYGQFRQAATYLPGYQDVETRIDRAYQAAITRVAVLPFENQTDVPDLSKRLEDGIYRELGGRLDPQHIAFTRLIGRDAIYSKLTVSELEDLTPEDAVSLGRRLGAARVVAGRIYSLRGSTNSDVFHRTIFHKRVERDSSGATQVRFVEEEFEAVLREHEVSIHFDFQVLDTDGDSVLVRRSDSRTVVARVVYSDFPSVGECSDYCLVPPEVEKSDPDRVLKVEAEWKSHFGSWSLPGLLEQARNHEQRSHYRSEYRGEFLSGSHERPIFLGELPGENELALVALDDLWRPLLDTLRELDDR